MSFKLYLFIILCLSGIINQKLIKPEIPFLEISILLLFIESYDTMQKEFYYYVFITHEIKIFQFFIHLFYCLFCDAIIRSW